MSNRDKREGTNFKSDNLDVCLAWNCPAVLVSVLGCFLLLLLVSAAAWRKWKVRRQEKKTKQCLNTVEMEFQFLGQLYESI